MEQLFLTGIGLLSIMLFWRFMWKPTILDRTRDSLFDLRDNVLREHFVTHNLPLDHEIYVNLRLLLNGHLRHTESLSIWKLGYLLNNKSNGVVERHSKMFEAKFETDVDHLKTLVNDIRTKAALVMFLYMIQTSLIFATMAVTATFVAYISKKASPFSGRQRAQATRTMEDLALST